MPRTIPARSETSSQCLFSSDSRELKPGSESDPTGWMGGDWVRPPPGVPSSRIEARNRVTPRPWMLMATPDTIWSTPNVTVAIACTRPPTAPNRTAVTMPAHGPYSQPIQPAPNVPRIIMPSSPMLTTPERSDQSPPTAAMPIRTAAARAAPPDGHACGESRADGPGRGQGMGAGDRAHHRQRDDEGGGHQGDPAPAAD